MTPSVQRVARAFVDKISSSNAVTVLRLSRNATAAPMTHDEALMALAAPKRVGEGLGPAPLFRHAIQTVATIARQVASAPHRWKPVVLIGAADYLERQNTDPMSRDWFGAAEAAARAHVITYVIDPTDLARTMLRPEPRVSGSFGLAAETGGYVFAGTSAAGAAVEQVWSEAGHYYHLEYKPLLAGKAPHRIDVRVKRAGVSARSRQSRWEAELASRELRLAEIGGLGSRRMVVDQLGMTGDDQHGGEPRRHHEDLPGMKMAEIELVELAGIR